MGQSKTEHLIKLSTDGTIPLKWEKTKTKRELNCLVGF
jgi:hypothetical protein